MRFWVPGDDLGKLATNQIMSENAGVTEEMVSNMLEKLGHESLLVFDGWDHSVSKVPVMPTHCNVFLAALNPPQMMQKMFSTRCKIPGYPDATFPLRQFTDSLAKCSVHSPFLTTDGNPMVTTFLCILVKHKIIKPHKNTKFSLCQIFSHLTRYLLTIQGRVNFAHSTLMIGKLAFDSLLENKHGMKLENDTEHIQSPFLIRGRDSLYTFPHVTLQLFLGALYFVLKLCSGESVDALIGADCRRPVRMMNELFLHFCLELLTKQQFSSFINRKRRKTAYKQLARYFARKINSVQLETADWSSPYCSLFNLALSIVVIYSKAKIFLNKILSKCQAIEMLYLRPNDHLDLILKNPYPNLRSIYLSNGDASLDTDVLHQSRSISDDLKIFLLNQEEMHAHRFVEYANRMNKKYSFYFFGRDKSEKTLDICQFLSVNVQKLFLSQNSYYCDILVSNEIPKCSSLTHLTIKAEYLRFPNATVKAISDAVVEGKLPKISHVYLDAGPNQDLQGVVLKSSLPSLTHLDIKQEIQGNDLLTLIENVLPLLESITIRPSGVEYPYQVLLRNQLTNLLSLALHGESNNDIFSQGLRDGKIPNLRELKFFDNNSDLTQILISEKLPYLTTLGIIRYKGQAIENLLTHGIMAQLNKLDLSDCRLGSQLSYLLRLQLPNLISLTLCQCELQTPDIQCLAQAYVEGKLPDLKHLDISHNNDGVHGNILENLFYKKCKWEKITSLNIQSVHCNHGQNFQDIQSMSHRAKLGFLPALQEIKFSMREKFIVVGSPPYWQDLHTMEIDCMNIEPTIDVFGYIASAMDTGLFPSLKVVRLCNWHQSRPTNKFSLRSKGVLVHFITRKVPQEVQPRFLFSKKCHACGTTLDEFSE